MVRELAVIEPEVERAKRLLFSEHHLSHTASAFYPSAFQRAAVLTTDGVGEWTTTSLAVGHGHHLEVLKMIHFPHSLGLLYFASTYYTGSKVHSGAYAGIGFGALWRAHNADLIRTHLIEIKVDGGLLHNVDYLNYCTGLKMTSNRFDELFGGKPRKAGDRLTQREMDLATSIQVVADETVLKLAKSTAETTGERNLCLAGGVALTYVEYSARIQTFHKETNPRYHALIQRFKTRTGCPVIIINTSFNVRGEPIVCSLVDAFRCFIGTEIEVLGWEIACSRRAARVPRSRSAMNRRSNLTELLGRDRRDQPVRRTTSARAFRWWQHCG